jgi:hypothetical protein
MVERDKGDTPISSNGFYMMGVVNEVVGRRVERTHHRVFDVEVDAGLRWVDTDLDGIVYCPVEGVSGSCVGNWDTRITA